MNPGDIVNAQLSSCCNASITPIKGHNNVTNGRNKDNQFIPFGYKCNYCGRSAGKIEKPMWVITDKLKYKLLSEL